MISGGVYLLVHRLIVRRLEAMQSPLAAIAAGDFQTRLPAEAAQGDEIGRLSQEFNLMVSRLEAARQLEFERRRERNQATVQERERIARDLHDGLAQILGFVGTKAMAVRLLLSQGKLQTAEDHLQQLEEAARDVLVDVRQAILGLRVASAARPRSAHPFADLRRGVQSDERNTGAHRPARFPGRDFDLPAEAELELLRIVQEAFSNIRKHAAADNAWVRLRRSDGRVELTVGDDGIRVYSRGRRSRSVAASASNRCSSEPESIGAELQVETEPGPRHDSHHPPQREEGSDMRILVADDHSLFRDGLVSLLEAAGHEVVGQVGDGKAAVESATRLQPDVLLLDISMPQPQRPAGPRSDHHRRTPGPGGDVDRVRRRAALFEAMRAGAAGYLLKSLTSQEFLARLEGLARGEPAVTPRTTARLMNGLARGVERSPRPGLL